MILILSCYYYNKKYVKFKYSISEGTCFNPTQLQDDPIKLNQDCDNYFGLYFFYWVIVVVNDRQSFFSPLIPKLEYNTNNATIVLIVIFH